MNDLYSFENSISKYSHISSRKVLEGSIEDPQITVFIPTYKRAETLKYTMDSVLNQVGDIEYEIVVVNNDPEGITGATKELLESYCSDRIYYYVNEENIGPCGNWNRGMELARAEYVAMIHDDDMLSPYFLEAIMTAIYTNKKPGILGVGYYPFTSKKSPVFQKPEILHYREVTKKSFFFGQYINIAGMTVRKDLFMEIGGYAEEYFPNLDTNLIYQFLIKDRVINVEHPLAAYRKEMNASLSEGAMESIICMMEDTRRNIAAHEPFAKRWMRYFDREFLYKYVCSANEYWDIHVDYKPIFKRYGFSEGRPCWCKMKLMNFLQKLAMKRG